MGRLNYERTPARRGELQLDRMRRLLGHLGRPQSAAPVIHLAGTKGKGSTAAILSQVLTAAGRRVGLYTSPHLSRLEERIQIDNQPCTSGQFVELVNQAAPIVASMDAAKDAPTFFELSTALAMLHFADSSVDVVVLETGLGGRLDSTNVCDPLVSIITSISLDHTKLLGDTLDKIAMEKCGIIKPGRPVISGVQEEPARSVIRAVAEARSCPLLEAGSDFAAQETRLCGVPPATRFRFQRIGEPSLLAGLPAELPELQLGLLGSHQAANAAIAIASLAVVESLAPELYQHDETLLRSALAGAAWPARIELARTEPLTVIDVAHNTASALALVDTLAGCFPPEMISGPRILVAAISKDKDAQGILGALLPHFDQVIFTRFVTNPRSVEPAQLLRLARQLGAAAELRVCEHPVEAWEQSQSIAQSIASAGDKSLTCVAGSFFLAAELHELVRQAPWVRTK